MPDQPAHQPSHRQSQSLFEIIDALQNRRREIAGVDDKVEAALDISRAMLAQSAELLAKADAALRRR